MASTPEAGVPTARRVRLVLLASAAVLFFLRLGARDLWNPNEPIYGRVIREMVATGDWLVPRANGAEFWEKPHLYYWVGAAASTVAGAVSETTVRFPAALAGLLGVWGLFEFTLRRAGLVRAAFAGAVLATTYMYWWCSRTIQMDVLVTASTLFAATAAADHLDGVGSRRRNLLVLFAALALGALSKGPVGFVLPGLVFLAYAAITKRVGVRPLLPLVLPAVAAVVAFVAYTALLSGRPEGASGGLGELLYRQNVTRFLSAWDHQRPWHYYLPYFWLDLAPWSLLLPVAAFRRDRSTGDSRLARLCLVWILAVVAFFSIASSKRSPYILPVAPAVALLAAEVLEGAWTRAGRLTRGALAAVLAVGALLATAGLVVLARPFGPADARPLAVAGSVALVVAGAVLGAGAFRGARPAIAATFAAILGLEIFAGTWGLPFANRFKSARPFAEAARREAAARGATLHAYRVWPVSASYVFYVEGTIEALDDESALRRVVEGDRPALVIVEDERAPEARRVLGDREPVARRRVGGSELLLFATR